MEDTHDNEDVEWEKKRRRNSCFHVLQDSVGSVNNDFSIRALKLIPFLLNRQPMSINLTCNPKPY